MRKQNYAAANARRKVRALAARASGICTRCLEAPARPGKDSCGECAARMCAVAKRHIAKRHAQGLCKCGQPQRPGKTMCAPCARLNVIGGCRSVYNLTAAQMTRLRAAKVCELCGNPPKPGKALQVDHDHATGLFRAILCRNCNIMLGFALDCPELLIKAAKYIRAGGVP